VFALVLPDLGDAAVDRPYTYRIPPQLAGQVVVGGRVLAPLGGRQVAGYVLALCDTADVPVEKVRPLIAVKSARAAFTAEQGALTQWLAERYLCPLQDALRPCLAEAGAAAGRRRWQCTDDAGVTTLLPDPALNGVLAFLRAQPGATTAQVRARFGDDGAAALDTLRRDGLIRPQGAATAKARAVTALFPRLTPAQCIEAADALPARAAKQAILLRWLADETALTAWEPVTAPELARRAGVGTSAVQACVEKGLLEARTVLVRRNPWEQIRGRKAVPPPLTDEQAAAVAAIGAATTAHAAASFLLYGVTGSGKTEVFLHAIADTLAAGRQAIVLVPEISLTAQAMALYHGRFPGQVAVLHSHLSTGERYDEWQRIAAGDARVVLGARSAIFAPCPDVGLIIIDEEHESSYKQESSPRYHAKAVALERGRLAGAPVVLASATPSLESMREAELGTHTLLRLPQRIEARPLPTVKLVDLRRMTTRARILSAPLREAIAARLAAGQQTILFLNRRGYSHTLLCRECGYQESCPDCAVPLTFHKLAGLLRCHHCDYQKPAIATCPSCRGMQIAYKGVGTEQLEAEVQALWPEARLGRLDRDTASVKGAHHEILEAFGREEMDILIGTQMVAKGFDFPKVTLVGVIAADTSLGIPDFRAPERTFQLLTQVAGRAGRSEWPGEVLVQTYQPEHYAVRCAMEHDYDLFYRTELTKRGDAQACWPPLTGLINILVNGENEDDVRATAQALSRAAREGGAARLALPPMAETTVLPGLLDFLRAGIPAEAVEDDPLGAEALLGRDVPTGVTVNDAVPCPLVRLRGRYRYHVELRGSSPAALRALARTLHAITPPKGVFVVIDVDPLTLA
jgi:primosomal protein N' (replication factor Y)